MKKTIVFLLMLVGSEVLAADLVTCPSGGFGINLRTFLVGGGLGGPLDDGGALVNVASVFPQGIRISGTNYTSVFMNVNGNISFGTQYATYTPIAIPGLDRPLIAPYFADADIRGGGDVFACVDAPNGRVIFTWNRVGYYDQKSNKRASFQAILTNANAQCGGLPTADIEFRYNLLEWTTGDLSGGTNGLGGTPAVAGIDAGDTINAVALPNSGTSAVMNLVNLTNANDPGVFRYRLANGTLPSCGNSTLEVCETCDLGAQNDNNGSCTEICQLNVCGDGYVHIGVEPCDRDEIAPGFDQCPSGYEGFPICNNDPASAHFDGTCTLSAVPSGCDDIDECALGTDNCDLLATCTNTVGSFFCTCPSGYSDTNSDGTLCEDIDECALGTDNCDPLTQCTNTPGSFTCSACPSGYTDTNGDGTLCEDIDECALGTDNCDPLTLCTNTIGSFTCGACPDGYIDANGDGTLCVDIDECALGTDNCDPLTQCTNTPGGFTCGACPDGYTNTNGDGTLCTDIDECALGTDNCDPLTQCTNTPGGFTCGACPDGYIDANGDGTLCEDIDECADLANPVCDELTTCINTPGGFECSNCPPGYRDVNGDGSLCEDIDECADLQNPVCDELTECTNTDGGFECTECPEGYLDVNGDGTVCEDIDECLEDPCAEGVTCNNIPGGFLCGECPEGYTDVHGDGTVCEDIDECLDEENPVCGEGTSCTNTPGGFVCSKCPEGYIDVNSDGTVCEDINECLEDATICGQNSVCTNTPGGFDCACREGYETFEGECVSTSSLTRYVTGSGCTSTGGTSAPLWVVLLGLLGWARRRL